MSASAQTFDQTALALDGVRYALLRGSGGIWRMASLNPAWAEELALNPVDAVDFAALAARNTWLAPDEGDTPVAVMCCGLGAVYPGMGRSLYDNFPAARQAMDRIAAISHWDVLSLMDESNPGKINQSRWQIPYLFLLEYAQWAQLCSLGFSPALVCGHSLGELVALCLAGVYSVESAWFLMDTHAAVLADLEARSGNSTAMLAIPADISVISDILREYPAVAIANHNTSRQYILAGPREDLARVRKSLRRKHIPAMFLSMGMAFHNTAMRTLRMQSQRRLNGLEMHSPRIPLLSCVTTQPYPATQKDICSHIMDLEENAVLWPELMDVVRQKYGISHFVELGPQETLCGLVQENVPEAWCAACGRKNNEVLAMRQTCAKLFVLGGLKYSAIAGRLESRPPVEPAREPAQPVASGPAPLSGIAPEDFRAIMEIIAEISGKPASELRPELDLRYDLALRSSNFPWLVQEAERRLGREIPLENLFQISTVGDLALFLSGNPKQDIVRSDGDSRHSYPGPPPFLRFAPKEGDWTDPARIPLNVCVRANSLDKGGLIVIFAAHDVSPRLFLSLAPSGCIFAVPGSLLDKFSVLRKAGAGLLPLPCGQWPDPSSIERVLAALPGGNPEGIFIVPPEEDCAAAKFAGDGMARRIAAIAWPAEKGASPWICALQRFHGLTGNDQPCPPAGDIPGVADFFAKMAVIRAESGADLRAIAWLMADNTFPDFSSDMLVRELAGPPREAVLWRQWEAPDGRYPPLYCPAADCLYPIYEDKDPPQPPRCGRFAGMFQISRYFERDFSGYGSHALYRPTGESESFRDEPCLPLSAALGTMISATRFLHAGLRISGFIDLRVFSLPSLPEGITREGRIDCRSIPWMLQDGAMTRIDIFGLSVRSISANGRHGANWQPLIDGGCMLAGRPGLIPPVWEDDNAFGDESFADADMPEMFYEALGMSGNWRILSHFRMHSISGQGGEIGHTGLAALYVPQSFIENGTECNYKDFLYLVEGALQGGLAVLAHENGAWPEDAEDLAARLRPWSLCGVDLIRFDAWGARGPGQYRLRIGQYWQDEKTARFNVQIHDADGHIVLTMHNMEFNHAACTA